MFDVERIGSIATVLAHARIASPAVLLELTAWLACASGLGMLLSRVRDLSLLGRAPAPGGRGPSRPLLVPPAIRRIAALLLVGLAFAPHARPPA